jgi:hypothetical protein
MIRHDTTRPWSVADEQNRLAAVPAGRYKGCPVYRVPVTVEIVDTSSLDSERHAFTVLATSAADAANWARDRFAEIPCSNITARGPRGGIVRRYVGWESAIAARLFAPRGPVQLDAWPETLT